MATVPRQPTVPDLFTSRNHVSSLQNLQAEFVSFVFLPFLFSVILHIELRFALCTGSCPLFRVFFYRGDTRCPLGFAFSQRLVAEFEREALQRALCAVSEELDCCLFITPLTNC